MRILLTVALGLSACALARQDACALSDVFERYDCGHVGITEQECVQRNCCWVPSSKHGEAWCFKKQGATQYVDVGETDSPEWAVSSHKWQLRKGAAQFGDDFAEARVSVGYYGDGDRSDVVRVEITNAEHERFTVPSNAQPSPDALTYSPLKQVPSQRALNVKVENDQDMGAFVTVARNNREATTLLDTRNEFGVTLQEQYLQATLTLPGDNDFAFYGLGERVLPFRLPDGRDGPHTFAMWTADVLTPDDQNVYGHHPFAVFVAADGTASGLLLRNVNAQEVEIVRQKEENRRLLQWRTTGGVLDFFVFAGATPAQVVQQAQYAVLGRPMMPPLWSLGWQYCRWGFENLAHVKRVTQQLANHAIPFDTMYFDIDYMHAYEMFTYDDERFPATEVKQWVDTELHAKGRRLVVILDPGIHVREGYDVYERAKAQGDVFLKTREGTDFIGSVWPGRVHFPDWSSTGARQWWLTELREFLKLAPIDGLWIDMNEVANFCHGQCTDDDDDDWNIGLLEERESKYHRAADFNPRNPPYRIKNTAGRHVDLNYKTLDMDVQFVDGNIEYDVHSTFGHREGILTAEDLAELRQERPFVLSRSTTLSSGHWMAHWLGDNRSDFYSMRRSIAGMLNFQLFGIPMVGADICGFAAEFGNMNELCARWTALGSFSPFARNHNALGNVPQWPYLFPDAAKSARRTGSMRYRLLHHWSTLFFKAHTQGGQVLYPLSFLWPNEQHFRGTDDAFVLGEHLLVAPVLDEGARTVWAPLPAGEVWYDLWNGQLIADTTSNTEAKWMELAAPLDHINVLARGGLVLPTQAFDADKGDANVADLLKNAFSLTAFVGGDGAAHGELFLDDGVQRDATAESTVMHMRVATETSHDAVEGLLRVSVPVNDFAGAADYCFEKITVFDATHLTSSVEITAVTLNGRPASEWLAGEGFVELVLPCDGTGDADAVLPLGQDFFVTWSGRRL